MRMENKSLYKWSTCRSHDQDGCHAHINGKILQKLKNKNSDDLETWHGASYTESRHEKTNILVSDLV